MERRPAHLEQLHLRSTDRQVSATVLPVSLGGPEPIVPQLLEPNPTPDTADWRPPPDEEREEPLLRRRVTYADLAAALSEKGASTFPERSIPWRWYRLGVGQSNPGNALRRLDKQICDTPITVEEFHNVRSNQGQQLSTEQFDSVL